MMSARSIEAYEASLPEGRRHDRTHLFLGALLCSKTGSCPVHVRNISPTGALIEGSIAPEKGETLVLKRGGLEASATIVWKVSRKAGIAFVRTIHVADWISKRAIHQDRVDDIIRTVRSGSAGSPAETGERGRLTPATIIEGELEALKNHLAELEHGLTADIVLVATHPEIQLLDLALQSVERILQKLRQH